MKGMNPPSAGPPGRFAVCLLAFSMVATQAFAQSTMIPNQNTTPWRMPWTRGSERFQRHWQICAPLTPEQAAAVLDPSIDYDAPTAIPPWTPLTSWSDDINLEGMVPINPDHVALVRTTVARAGAGQATLLIGADGTLEVSVNGVPVHRRSNPEPFAFDQTAVPVLLREGENEFILKLVNASGPMKIAFRIVESGAVVTRPGEIGPTLLDEADGMLTLRTDIRKDVSGAPVDVEVVLPGGAVIAHAAVVRGETVRFKYGDWPEGPVEIRCTTLNGACARRAVHLAWYHGNALADARELIAAAAKEPPGPEGDHVRMLAELVQDFIDHQLARSRLRSQYPVGLFHLQITARGRVRIIGHSTLTTSQDFQRHPSLAKVGEEHKEP